MNLLCFLVLVLFLLICVWVFVFAVMFSEYFSEVLWIFTCVFLVFLRFLICCGGFFWTLILSVFFFSFLHFLIGHIVSAKFVLSVLLYSFTFCPVASWVVYENIKMC